MKIASTKNENPSSVNASPNTAPNRDMNSGHRMPSSKLRIVPVTTPAANSAAMTFDQRRAMRQVDLVAASPAEPLAEHDERGERDAEAHERDVHRERERLQLTRLEQVVLARCVGGDRCSGEVHPRSIRCAFA